MILSDFDYKYPKGLVAQRPLPRRDASRMMVIDRALGTWRHARFAELPTILRKGDLVIVNDSRVAPARLFGVREDGRSVDILVVEPVDDCSLRATRDARRATKWRCLVKKTKRIRMGERFFFGTHADATVVGRDGDFLVVEFTPQGLKSAMKYHGVPPLPPYIGRDGFSTYTKEDRERYQTVFAKRPGSAAAPTAGLHFSKTTLKRLAAKGIDTSSVTLHVGIDTFQPLRETHTARMHGERYEIGECASLSFSKAKKRGSRVVAVGTTTVRALETVVRDQAIEPEGGVTKLFITQGFRFGAVDALITNFHQPRSTLLMLVCAFAGREFILSCYEEAIRNNYRLFSYGDCMLIV